MGNVPLKTRISRTLLGDPASVNAATALDAARAAGLSIVTDGDDLVLQASVSPPVAILDLLSIHKPEIVTLLRPGNDGWSGEDWREFFEERAGIAEFDGGLPRDQAEARAFSCCVGEWLSLRQMSSIYACSKASVRLVPSVVPSSLMGRLA